MKIDISILLRFDLKTSTDFAWRVSTGKQFHSAIVLGKKEYLKQSFFVTGREKEIADDFLVFTDLLLGVILYWDESTAAVLLIDLYSNINLEEALLSSRDSHSSIFSIWETLLVFR